MKKLDIILYFVIISLEIIKQFDFPLDNHKSITIELKKKTNRLISISIPKIWVCLYQRLCEHYRTQPNKIVATNHRSKGRERTNSKKIILHTCPSRIWYTFLTISDIDSVWRQGLSSWIESAIVCGVRHDYLHGRAAPQTRIQSALV